jgi:hypothetical protein
VEFVTENAKLYSMVKIATQCKIGTDCGKKSNSLVIPDINVTTILSDKIHERDRLTDYLMKEIG